MRVPRLFVALSALALIVAACGDGNQGGGSQSPGAEGSPGGGGETGGTVSLIGVWADEEEESLRAMLAPFEESTGITVEYEATRDLNAVLQTRVSGGNPPDVAGLPGPGQLRSFSDALVPLNDVLDMDAVQENYAQAWLDLGTVDDNLVGLMTFGALKGAVFYNTAAFEDAGYEIPESYDDLETLVEEIADSGTPPWCIGVESGEASGWPATDWIETFLLRQSGPDAYNQWWNGELEWTSDEVRSAFEAFGQYATDERYVAGGSNTVSTTNFAEAGNPLFDEPPGCYLHHQGSFMSGLGAFAEHEAGTDFDFFRFPDINDEFSGAVTGGGDLFGMFNDTPQARELMNYLASAEAQEIWIGRGGKLSPNRAVSLDVYPDEASRTAAEILTGAETVGFDASDLMPGDMNSAFWSGTLDYIQNPDDLDAILEELEEVRQDAYGE